MRIYFRVRKILHSVVVLSLLSCSVVSYAQDSTVEPAAAATTPVSAPAPASAPASVQPIKHTIHKRHVRHRKPKPRPTSLVVQRVNNEDKVTPNSFALTFYEPTYLLPYYFTGSPDNKAYIGQTPNNEQLKHNEFKYKLSFKVPIWKNILNRDVTLYLAYTQMSYWQVYNNDAFFRETDYSPEIFVAKEINFHLFRNWAVNFINVGVVHQSNGFGGVLERSWNRAYVSAVASNNDWMVTLKPWMILENGTYHRQNPDLAKFMGYGEIIVAYKYGHQVFSVDTHNVIESGGRRSGTTVAWSFPLTAYLKGYVQAYSGYGQSLIEYNHRTNSVGLGLALSDWV